MTTNPFAGAGAKGLWAAWPVLLALHLGVAACSRGPEGGSAEAGDKAAEIAVQVFATQARTREVVEPIIGTGTIAPLQNTDIGPLVDGVIDAIYVKVGDEVQEGQPLFRTRTVDYDLRVKELSNRVKLAKAEAKEASAEVARLEPLLPKGIVPLSRVEKAKAARDGAAAGLAMAEAQLSQAQQLLKDATVTAPFNGVITARNVDPGKFMATRMGGGMMGPSGVVTLMHIDVVAAIVTVAEIHLPKLSLDMPARVRVDGLDRSFDSVVHVLNDFVDPQSRAVEVRIGIENKDHAIKPGLFAIAEILPPARSALALERAAVLGQEGERYVFIAEGTRAKRIAVTTGELDAESVEIVSGVDETAQILKGPNLNRLRDGALIEIIQPAATPAPAAAG